MNSWANIKTIAKRELGAYLSSPLPFVFIVIFLALAGALTFHVGGFFERGQADLEAFFTFHPWLYLFLVPALSMRLWAEERKAGDTDEQFFYKTRKKALGPFKRKLWDLAPETKARLAATPSAPGR